MQKLVIKRAKGGFLLSDKAKVLEYYYNYINLNRDSDYKEFYATHIDSSGDLTLDIFRSWVYPTLKQEGVNSDDKALLEAMLPECESVSLLSTLSSLIHRNRDKRVYERARLEASRVSKEAKEIIIQEYLDSIAHKVA